MNLQEVITLNLILRNNDNTVGEKVVGGELGDKDHKEIIFILRRKENINFNEIHVPNFQPGDFEELRRQLLQVPCGVGESVTKGVKGLKRELAEMRACQVAQIMRVGLEGRDTT